MWGWLKFSWLWFQRTAFRAPDIADLWASIASCLLGGFVPWIMGYEVIISAPWWAQGLMVFGAVFVIRLILAPYWLWKDQKNRADKLESEAIKEADRLKAQIPYAHLTAMARYDATLTDQGHRADLVALLVDQYLRLRDSSIQREVYRGRSPDHEELFRISELILSQIRRAFPETPHRPHNGLRLEIGWNHYLMIFDVPARIAPKVTITELPKNSHAEVLHVTNISCEVRIWPDEPKVENFGAILDAEL